MYPSLKLPIPLLLLYVGCFPFVNFGTGYDTLPLLLLLFILFLGKRTAVGDLAYVLVIICAGSLAVSLITIDQFSSSLFIRGLANHATFIVAFIVAYECFCKEVSLEKHIKIINGIYFLGAVIELLNPRVFDFLVSGRTTLGRGVNSLTVEPTTFALICFCFVVLSMRYNSTKSRWIWVSLNSFAIVFLAKSALGILLLVIFLGTFFLKLNLKSITILSFTVALGFLISTLDFWDGSRVERLVSVVKAEGILRLILLDSSISGRVSNLICSFTYSFSNFGLPNGYFAFVEAYNTCNQAIFANEIKRGTSPKIMSTFGALIFELGPIILGLIIVILIRRKTGLMKFNKDMMYAIMIGCMPFTPGFVPLYLLFFNRKVNNA
jgi:hypothetical protein